MEAEKTREAGVLQRTYCQPRPKQITNCEQNIPSPAFSCAPTPNDRVNEKPINVHFPLAIHNATPATAPIPPFALVSHFRVS